ncbi:MAG: hypothetical protein WCJ58_03450 [bacterium]
MKRFFEIQLTIALIFLSVFFCTTFVVKSDQVGNIDELFAITGLLRTPFFTSKNIAAGIDSEKTFIGINAKNDDFAVTAYSESQANLDVLEQYELVYGKISVEDIKVDKDLIYKNSFTDVPLLAKDYYWRKYENALAGAQQLNTMPILKPNDRVELIRDQYIDIKTEYGYVRPGYGYPFGSGVCWTVTTLGLMMDQANRDFRAAYGIPLFVYSPGDRAPHTHYYETYGGHGYTVMELSTGVPVQDYRFQVNPQINSRTDLSNFKIKIVIVATNSNNSAAYGQSLGALVISNYEF